MRLMPFPGGRQRFIQFPFPLPFCARDAKFSTGTKFRYQFPANFAHTHVASKLTRTDRLRTTGTSSKYSIGKSRQFDAINEEGNVDLKAARKQSPFTYCLAIAGDVKCTVSNAHKNGEHVDYTSCFHIYGK